MSAWLAPLIAALTLAPAPAADLRDDFAEPPAKYRSMPFWHINGTLTADEITAQLRASQAQSGFTGVAVLPVSGIKPAYLSEDYFARYGDLLKTARGLGMEVILYDDINFPSGSAGGQLARLYPRDLMKRLDKTEEEVVGPAAYRHALPAGELMAAVAMETTTLARVDLAPWVKDGQLAWQAPAGRWRVMLFACVEKAAGLVDYLDPAAVDHFISLTYDQYYRRFAEYFGNTIQLGFYDDVGFYARTRPWTPGFNAAFRKRFGSDPSLLYPALWHDIGPDTEAARVALFDCRAELLAEGYPRRVAEWCAAHGIRSTGHPPGNYDPCPVDMHCDTFKFYRHSQVPLLDYIFYHGHGRPGFKLISSAANVYDRPVVAAEIYGAFAEAKTDADMLYRAAMELFARGVNFLVPHGMWYDPQRVRIPPLISHFSDKLRPALPDYNRWVGRSCRLLQGGAHVADVALFYPIASLEAFYRFSLPDNQRWGHYVPPEADYQAVSDLLTSHVRRDFTFIHPDTLESQCRLEGDTLRLANQTNPERYRVVLLPGGQVIPWASLRKLQAFYEAGGKVIATTCLPRKSAEVGHDADVQRVVRDMFGDTPAPAAATEPYRVRIEVRGATIRTYVRGTLVDTTVDATFARGSVGLREAPEEASSFANLRVTTPDGQPLFAEDFRDGLKRWVNTEHAEARDGRLKLTDNQTLRVAAGAGWTDYNLEVDLLDEQAVSGLVFRAVDDKNYCMWQFRPATGSLRPHLRVNGGWRVLKGANLAQGVDFAVTPTTRHANARGGVAWFAPRPTAGTLRALLDEALPVADVRFEGDPRVTSGNGVLSYIHKVIEGREVYLFANSSDDAVDTFVRLRGRLQPEVWDPHSGRISPAEAVTQVDDHGTPVTRLRLRLGAAKSTFVVSPTPG